MQKRGQITVFIIIGIFIIIVLGIFLYLSSYSTKEAAAASVKETTKISDADIVNMYVESCLKSAGNDELFNRMGLQGAYTNPEGDSQYGEPGAGIPSPVPFQGKKVPYYLEASCDKYCAPQNCPLPPCPFIQWRCRWNYIEHIPDSSSELDIIRDKIAKYVEIEFAKCFNADMFKEIGINIELPMEGPKTEVTINEEDVSISMNYSLKAKQGDKESNMKTFRIKLPIRLNALYSSALEFTSNVERIEDTEFFDEVPYNLMPDCPSYDKNGLTNVYTKNSDDNSAKIVQLVDFSTYNSNYFNSYIFQFALKNVNVIGKCSG